MNDLVVKKVSGAGYPKYIVRVVVSVWDLAYDSPVWDADFVVLDVRDSKRVIHKLEQAYKDLVDGIIRDYKEEGVKEAIKDINLNTQELIDEVYCLLEDTFNEGVFEYGSTYIAANAYTQFEVEVRRIAVI